MAATKRARRRDAPLAEEISASEMCRRAGVARITLHRYVERGIVEPSRTIQPSGQQLFRVADVAVVRDAVAEGRRRNGKGAA